MSSVNSTVLWCVAVRVFFVLFVLVNVARYCGLYFVIPSYSIHLSVYKATNQKQIKEVDSSEKKKHEKTQIREVQSNFRTV